MTDTDSSSSVAAQGTSGSVGVPDASNYPKISKATKRQYMSMFALAMMNVATIAGLANDPQQAFYGLSSITFFAIGAIVFFIPTALVTAELATGWPRRGGIFRWVGEGIGKGWAFCCLFILWMECSINFGVAPASGAATILFYGPYFNKAVAFAENPQFEIWIVIGWLCFYWFLAFLATKGLKIFASVAKYGVMIGSLIPLGLMIILVIVWFCEGHHSAMSWNGVNLIPKWQGLSTLSLAAGVLFSYAGVDMNAAHIKELKKPEKQFPQAIIIAMILAFLIFVVGTLIIATVIPYGQLNVLYALFATFRVLGATFGFPWLYMVLTWALLCNTIAMTITNFAGPSFMLGQVGKAGFLPKWTQNYNKHGMPSKLMYIQCIFMTIIAFLVTLLPNVEGFVILITQAITLLYLFYYVLMFIAYLRLKYDQPIRPRAFKIPGVKVGGWIVCIVGLIACGFGMVLAVWPPAQVSQEVGSPVTYIVVILAITAFVLILSWIIYLISRKSKWADPNNVFTPFTWQIEGLKKPGKSLSDIPTEVLSYDQNPMGMEIKHIWGKDAKLSEVPAEILEGAKNAE